MKLLVSYISKIFINEISNLALVWAAIIAHAWYSGGHGFESHRELGFFLLLSFHASLHQWSVINKDPQGGAGIFYLSVVKAI